MESLRLPDYYIDSNGLPNILNNKQQLLMKRPIIKNQNTRIINNNNNNKTIKCGCNTLKTKQNTRRQDADEIDTVVIVRPNSHEIKNLFLTKDCITDAAGLNKKMKCIYNEIKKQHMENKSATQTKLKDHNIIYRNREDLNS